jgi:hypothetical protein
MPGLIKTTQMGTGMGTTYGPCPTCDGMGQVFDEDASLAVRAIPPDHRCMAC